MVTQRHAASRSGADAVATRGESRRTESSDLLSLRLCILLHRARRIAATATPHAARMHQRCTTRRDKFDELRYVARH